MTTTPTQPTPQDRPDDDDRFSWREAEDAGIVVVQPREAIAIYENTRGDVVIRQDRSDDPYSDGDAWVVVPTSCAVGVALAKCSGKECQVVATMQAGCAAIAIDGRNACGPHGFAVNARLGRAQNSALRECYKYGGHDCVIRAWACDSKG